MKHNFLFLIEIVDIYSRVVIAVFGFIAPTATLLLPILGERIEMLRKDLQIRESMLNKLKTELDEQTAGVSAMIPQGHLKTLFEREAQKYKAESADKFALSIEDTRKELGFLNLKDRIRFIFSRLIFAIALIMAYHCFKIELLAQYLPLDYNIRTLLPFVPLGFSIFFFRESVTILWKLVCIIIDGKQSQGITLNEANGDIPLIPVQQSNG